MSNTSNHDPVATWMQELAAKPLENAALRDPRVIWWRAQALRGLDRQRHASAKLQIGERIQIACTIIAGAILLAWLINAAPESISTMSLRLIVGVTGAFVTIVLFAIAVEVRGERKGTNESSRQ